MNKYGARKVKTPDGNVFDSRKEYNRWCELKILEKAERIAGLKRQVKFELVPAQRLASTETYKAGPQKGMPKPGAVIEMAVTYVADFCYWKDGNYVVEDVKGYKTEAYKIKRKLMLWVHGIKIVEI